jgi:hypothetical protein
MEHENDLKRSLGIRHSRGNKHEERTHVYRQADFLSGRRTHTTTSLSSECHPLSWELQDQRLHLSISVSMHGLCATDLSGKSERYRIVPSISKKQTLSHGHSWQCIQKHLGQRQQGEGLAHLCRLRSLPDSESPCTLFGRRLRRATGSDGIRTGCNDYRPVSISIPMGAFSSDKGCSQTPYATGSSRQHPNVHSYKRWQDARCKYSGLSCYRARSVLHNGPRISGFCQTVYVAFKQGVLRHPRQIQFQISQTVFPSCRSVNGAYLRSKRYANRLLFCLSLSGENSQDQISRHRIGQDSGISYQQFHSSSNDDSSTISMPMAGGTVFQVDQTEPQNQEFLRNKRQCSQNSGLDRRIDIRSGGDHKETSQITDKSLYDSTDIERDHV